MLWVYVLPAVLTIHEGLFVDACLWANNDRAASGGALYRLGLANMSGICHLVGHSVLGADS